MASVLGPLACGGGSGAIAGGVVRVAVAANFADAHAELAERFAEQTGIAVRTSVGSTGHLYAQIVNGAPFDVFLAADTASASRLEAEGLAVPGSRFTYAEGRLALYAPAIGTWRTAAEGTAGRDTPDPSPPGAALHGLEVLRATADPVTGEGRLALANPRLAPYGMAARQALVALGLWDALGERIVMAENIGQAFQFVESGAAELGLVAGSYVIDRPASAVWPVPADLYAPIRQDAVRLDAAGDSAAARAFLEYLGSDEARGVIEARGYGLPRRERDGSPSEDAGAPPPGRPRSAVPSPGGDSR